MARHLARAKRMKERPMRWVFCLAMMLGTAAPAFAADLDVLRGSEPAAPVVTVGPATFTRWSGLYFGGLVSYSSASSDFSQTTPGLLDASLRGLALDSALSLSEKTVLGRGSDVTFGGGAFLGYNTQWQDLILGVEATYTHTNLNTTASSSPIGSGVTNPHVVSANGAANSVNISGTGTLDLTDYGTARFRAGYVVGNLLPYGFVGVAVGRAGYSVTSRINGQQSSTSPPFPLPGGKCDPTLPTCVNFDLSNSAGQNNALLWGFSAGGGLDWAVTQNFFLRGEFEFVQFAPISSINLALISGRVGAGYKF
jgi:outer membrane immunogenic protein